MYRLQSLWQSLCPRMGLPWAAVSSVESKPGDATPARVAHRLQSLQECLTCSPECIQECPCSTVASTGGSPFEGVAPVPLTAQKCAVPSSSSLFFLLLAYLILLPPVLPLAHLPHLCLLPISVGTYS